MLLRLSLLSVLCLFILSAPPEGIAQDAGIPALVKATKVRVRAKPTTRSSIVTNLTKNTEVLIVEEKNGWSRIRAGEIRGWIKSTLLKKMPPPVDDESASSGAETGGGIDLYSDQPVPDLGAVEAVAVSPGLEGAVLVEAAVTMSGSVLRAYPGSQAAVLAQLPEHALVVVHDRIERWVKCAYEGQVGWVPVEHLAVRGTRPLSEGLSLAEARTNRDLQSALQSISASGLRKESEIVVDRERRLRASVSALEMRAKRSGGSSLGISSSSRHFLDVLRDDARELDAACTQLERMSAKSTSDADREAVNRILVQGQATLQHFEKTLGRAHAAAPSPVMMYGGRISFAMGSHTRSTIYDYSTNAPTLQSSAWLNTPTYGNFRARLNYTDDIVTTQFTKLNTGIDWRLPMGTQQWSARVNLFRYDDDVPTNTYGLFDVHAGWEQLRQTGPAIFARAMYQGKTYEETQMQEFTAFSVNTGLRTMTTLGSAYEVNILNRYQSSDDMGLNFDMVTAYGLWHSGDGFSLRPAYEGYFSLADSGGAFLNYHRPGIEARWSRPTGITDYGVRADYRYHPDADNLTYGQFSLFAGHQEHGMESTNWNAVLMYQMNSGGRNPSFTQAQVNARSTASLFFIAFNSVLRYQMAEESDSVSMHFTDMYVNPGMIVSVSDVRLQFGPFLGTTMFLNNKTPALRDNLNNSARTGLSAHAMASFGPRFNMRAWGEYEIAFHFSEDPYVGRKREPTRLRLGAEGTVVMTKALNAFARAQVYSVDNDTGIKINLPDGVRDRDKIDDALLLIGIRYHL